MCGFNKEDFDNAMGTVKTDLDKAISGMKEHVDLK